MFIDNSLYTLSVTFRVSVGIPNPIFSQNLDSGYRGFTVRCVSKNVTHTKGKGALYFKFKYFFNAVRYNKTICDRMIQSRWLSYLGMTSTYASPYIQTRTSPCHEQNPGSAAISVTLFFRIPGVISFRTCCTLPIFFSSSAVATSVLRSTCA
jgi:hypothetical protein